VIIKDEGLQTIMAHLIREDSRLPTHATRQLMKGGARLTEGIKKLRLGITLQRVNSSSESEWECTVCMRVLGPWARVMEVVELWLEGLGSQMENRQL